MLWYGCHAWMLLVAYLPEQKKDKEKGKEMLPVMHTTSSLQGSLQLVVHPLQLSMSSFERQVGLSALPDLLESPWELE
eukprot:scaffold105768_cov19-Tisochrysis_lutea.AAC.1